MKRLIGALTLFGAVAHAQSGIGIEFNNSNDDTVNLVIGFRSDNKLLGGQHTDFIVGGQTYENAGTNTDHYYVVNLGVSSTFAYPLKEMVQATVGGRIDYQYINDKNAYNNGNGIDNDPYTAGIIAGIIFSPAYHPNYEIYSQLRVISKDNSGYSSNTGKSDPKPSGISMLNQGAIGIKYYM